MSKHAPDTWEWHYYTGEDWPNSLIAGEVDLLVGTQLTDHFVFMASRETLALIAAAPALLALLAEVAPDIDCVCGSGRPCWRCRADETIRRARGEEAES